jgi:four helix bundle protein
MRDYKKSDVWIKSHEANIFIKKNIAIKFPKEERFELLALLNRAALSIPLNIAEGCGRFTDKNLAHFLDTSLGSRNEGDYCCFAAQELGYFSHADYEIIN